MEEQKTSIFRKESLDRITSPEELDSYLVVTRPGVWITLFAILILLVGAFTWAIMGRLTTTLDVAVVAQDGEVVCLVPAEKLADTAEPCVTVADKSYPLSDAGYSLQIVTEDMDINLRLAGMLQEGAVVQPMAVDGELSDGVYEGQIVVEAVQPIRFIIN